MINIRYHIVSITAVFLALGIGIALGSTFLDNSTVSLLNRNIRSAENRITETRAENGRLRNDLDAAEARDEALIQIGSGSLLAGHLTDVPILIVAAPGADGDDVANLRVAVDRAGADLRGTLELRPDLALADGIDADVAEALGLDAESADPVRSQVFAQLNVALAAAGADAPAVPEGEGEGEDPDGTTTTTTPGAATTTVAGATTTTTTTAPATTTTQTVTTTTTSAPGSEGQEEGTVDELPVPDGEQPTVITALLDGKYLNLVPGPGRTADDPILETQGYRYVFVSGPDLDASANDLLLELLPEEDSPPAVVVSATVAPVEEGEDSPAPSAVARVRASATLTARYNTVDDVQTFSGLVATVLSLEDVGTAAPGQYGEGDGATAVLPPPS